MLPSYSQNLFTFLPYLLGLNNSKFELTISSSNLIVIQAIVFEKDLILLYESLSMTKSNLNV